MIKKQLRLILILATSAVLLIAAYFIIRPMVSETNIAKSKFDSEGDLLGPSDRPFVFVPVDYSEQTGEQITDGTADEIASISVKNSHGSFRVYKDEVANGYLIEGAEQLMYNQPDTTGQTNVPSITDLVATCGYMLSIEKLSDPASDDQYGLSEDKNPAVIDIKTKNGKEHKLFIGDKLVTGGAYYCKYAGKPQIYVISTSIEVALNNEVKDFISPLLVLPMDQEHYYLTDSFKLLKNGKLFVECKLMNEEERDTDNSYNVHKMVYPAEYTPSNTNYELLLRTLSSFKADRVITMDLSEENLVKYGFAKPSYEIEYLNSGVTRYLYFGNLTEDGLSYYVLSPGMKIIGTIKKQNAPFLEWGLIDFVDKTLFSKNIDTVSSIAVEAPGGISEKFLLNGKGKELVVTREKDSQVIASFNFRQFYRVILLGTLSDYGQLPENPEWLLTYKITLTNGHELEYKFYNMSTRRCFYTVNGVGEFYVSRNFTDKVLSDLKKLLAGEEIKAELNY